MKPKISLKPLLSQEAEEVKEKVGLRFPEKDKDLREFLSQYRAETGATINAAVLKFLRMGINAHIKEEEGRLK